MKILIAVFLLLVLPARAFAADPIVTVSGDHFVQAGKPITLRGVDMAYNSDYFLKYVKPVGANYVRIRVRWVDVEPTEGVINQSELDKLDVVVKYMQAQGINMDIDMRGANPAPSYVSTTGFFTTNAAKTQAQYKVFVGKMVKRYSNFSRVVGFGIFNEPHCCGIGVRASAATLKWEAPIKDYISSLAPKRAVFFNVRGGNYGIKRACFSCAGFKLHNAVFDWHSFYNGTGSMDADAENWLPSWDATHNQRTTTYVGTQSAQETNMLIPYTRTKALGIPMIVNEWGIGNNVVNYMTYNKQMAFVLNKYHLNYARWDMDNSVDSGLVTNGKLNTQGVWLEGELH